MRSLLKNEDGILGASLNTILYMIIIISMYLMFMPFLTFLSNVLINMGAPADITLFFLRCAQWGFILFALGVIIILLAKVWKKTHDTQLLQGGY